MKDYVIPKGNEKELIAMAKNLGFKELCMLYETSENKKLIEDDSIKISFGKVISVPMRKDLGKSIVAACAGDNPRGFFESQQVDMIYDLEYDTKKDPMKARNSGLNQVHCALAKKNRIVIAFSFASYLRCLEKEAVLGRLQQNIMLIRKYQLGFCIASFAEDPYEMRSGQDLAGFARIFGYNDKFRFV